MSWWGLLFFVISTNALSVNPLTYGLMSHKEQSPSNREVDGFHPGVWSPITILICSSYLDLPPPHNAKRRFQYIPSVNEHLTAVVTKSSLWLLSSSNGEGWHFILRVWLSQCGGQYLSHPHRSTCEGRILAQRNVSFTPSHKQSKSYKKGSDKKISRASNQHAARSCCFLFFVFFSVFLRLKVSMNTAGSSSQWFAWESYWFICLLISQWVARNAITSFYYQPYVIIEHHILKSYTLLWQVYTYFWPIIIENTSIFIKL